ncbi:MAG: DUF4142 domain-containing protein [Sphingomonas sp.]|uniref:DUF4142 domain-containing protein n=1 Tax=Sphingomonas sp. TaxID=28214 RepID=UPI001AD147FC|nr:DUF4142 domain-containing protein [Sphingomonas sp.]MBN8808494.1 DUF4142 domain-containing protein [Sphingomonas sp.]
MTRTAIVLLAATALAACSKGESANTVDAPAAPAPINMAGMSGMMMGEKFKAAQTAGQSFINSAAAADAFELTAARMALTAWRSPQVKTFAAAMIAAHAASAAKLKTVMAGMHPPMTPELHFTKAQQAMLDGLKGKTGAAFDAAYAAAEVASHQNTVGGLTYFSQNGNDWPELKQYAGAWLPTEAEHLRMAKGLK